MYIQVTFSVIFLVVQTLVNANSEENDNFRQVDYLMNLTRDFSDDQKFNLIYQLFNEISSSFESENRSGREIMNDFNDTNSILSLQNNSTAAAEQIQMPKVVLDYILRRFYSKRTKRPSSSTVHSHDNESCEYFTNHVCLTVRNYPLNAILKTIEKNRQYAQSALVNQIGNRYIDDLEDNFLDRSDDTNGFLCKSIIKFAKPQKAKAANGVWKYIVNTPEHTQTLRLEKCLKTNDSCVLLNENYDTRCLQVYNYHRLLSWDETKGLHLEIFKVPTCCTCHVDNYKIQYPPYGHVPMPKLYLDQISGSELEHQSTHYEYSDPNLPLYTKLYQAIVREEMKKNAKLQNVNDEAMDIDKSYSENIIGLPYKKKKHQLFPKSNRYNVKAHRSKSQLPINDLIMEETAIIPQRINSRNDTVNDIKRINYNYHPIIDFFDRQTTSTLSSSQRTRHWRPNVLKRRFSIS